MVVEEEEQLLCIHSLMLLGKVEMEVSMEEGEEVLVLRIVVKMVELEE